MSDKPTLLSERIEQRLSRCKQCGGTGSYDHKLGEMSCNFCADWLVVLREVKALEKQVEELQETVELDAQYAAVADL